MTETFYIVVFFYYIIDPGTYNDSKVYLKLMKEISMQMLDVLDIATKFPSNQGTFYIMSKFFSLEKL